MNKKGFTLIELLAVIVVISIIGLITTPVVINNIEKSRVASYRSSVTNLMDASKEYVTKNYENNDFPTGGIDITKTELNLKNNEFKNGVIAKENGVITAVDVYDGKYCARGEKNNLIVNKVESIEECKTSSGMDSTPPEIKRITVTEVTNTKIKVVVVASDIQSGIKEYEYCVGDICKTSTTNNYTFKGLKANTNYEIKVKVRNNNYRKDTQYKDEITESTKSIKVKTKAIEKPTIKVSSTAYGTGKKVIITYPSSGEEQINSYEINGKKEITQNSREEINVTENGIIKATIEMKATGEKVENEIVIAGIDKTAPNLKVHYFKDDTSWGKTKTIEIIASDLGSGLAKKPYSYDGGKTWMSSNKRTYNKEDEVVNIVVKDRVGNKSSQTFKLDKVDVTGPDKPNITNPTNGNWVNYDFALTVSSSDKRSGLGDWYYSYDNSNWTKYNNSTGKSPFTTTNFTKERNQEVYIRACDKLGNCSKSSSTYIRIDKTKPTCSWSGESTTWTKSNRTIKVKGTDSESGINEKYKEKSWNYTSGTTKTASLSYTIKDNAGNTKICSKTANIYVDKDAPTCVSSGGSDAWTNTSRTLTGTCSDSGSGCKGNASKYIDWEENKTNLSPGTVYDKVGNSVTCPANQTVRIDKTPPKCTSFIGDAGNYYNDNPPKHCFKFYFDERGGSGLKNGSGRWCYATGDHVKSTSSYSCDYQGLDARNYSAIVTGQDPNGGAYYVLNCFQIASPAGFGMHAKACDNAGNCSEQCGYLKAY